MPTDEDKKEKDEEKAAEEAVKPFENLDVRGITCFGWQEHASEKCWLNKAVFAQKYGWERSDKEGIEISLKENVDNCYFSIAQFDFVDLDDETAWHAEFNNMKMMWKLSLKDSPKAEVTMEQNADFFKSEMMKKCAQKAADKILEAKRVYEQVLAPRLENGELIAVDETKLAAILHCIDTVGFMDDLRKCKWYTA